LPWFKHVCGTAAKTGIFQQFAANSRSQADLLKEATRKGSRGESECRMDQLMALGTANAVAEGTANDNGDTGSEIDSSTRLPLFASP
jgi:hypothetical protein